MRLPTGSVLSKASHLANCGVGGLFFLLLRHFQYLATFTIGYWFFSESFHPAWSVCRASVCSPLRYGSPLAHHRAGGRPPCRSSRNLTKLAGKALRPVHAGDDTLAESKLSKEMLAGSTMPMTSTAFAAGEPIPAKYASRDASPEGQNVSPPLRWSGVPEGTAELALICEDPDAPFPHAFVHWTMYHLPPTLTELPEAIAPEATPRVASGVKQGKKLGEGRGVYRAFAAQGAWGASLPFSALRARSAARSGGESRPRRSGQSDEGARAGDGRNHRHLRARRRRNAASFSICSRGSRSVREPRVEALAAGTDGVPRRAFFPLAPLHPISASRMEQPSDDSAPPSGERKPIRFPDELPIASARARYRAGGRRASGGDRGGRDGVGQDHTAAEDLPGDGARGARRDRRHTAAAHRGDQRRGAGGEGARDRTRERGRIQDTLRREPQADHVREVHDRRHLARRGARRPVAQGVRHHHHRRGARAEPQHRFLARLPEAAGRRGAPISSSSSARPRSRPNASPNSSAAPRSSASRGEPIR